jgi:predicted TIM-barrel fold metal-dependent hydrolase
MLIDSHQHVFWHGRDDKGLIADMDSGGIDKAWLLTWEILPLEHAAGYVKVLDPLDAREDGTHSGIRLDRLITARDRYPDRFVLGYCPHPSLPSAPDQFEAAYHIHGVRVCGEWKFRMLFDDPRCLELYRRAGQLRCPVVLHLDVPYLVQEDGSWKYQPAWYGGTVANLERALQACPQTNFLGHAPGFWREISGNADVSGSNYPGGPVTPGGRLYRLFATYPNLYADLSAGSALGSLKRDPEHARKFLIQHADRLLFARDYYGHDLYQFLESLNLPQAVKDAIYFRNALKMLEAPATQAPVHQINPHAAPAPQAAAAGKT